MASRRVFLVGGHITPFIGKGSKDFIWKKHPDFGKRSNPELKDYINKAIQGALASVTTCSSGGALVDRVFVGNFAGELFNQQGHLGAAVAGADISFRHIPSMRVEGACASGGLAAAGAVQAIMAGDDCVLAVGAEMQSAASAREGGTFLARAADFHRQADIDDFTFPCLFARRTKEYFRKYPHASFADLGALSAKAYGNGNLNPLAHMHIVKVSADHASNVSEKNPNFLSNEDYREFLKVTDCSQVSDGGAACIFASEEGVHKLGGSISDGSCVEVLGNDYGVDNLWADPLDPTKMCTTQGVVHRLLAKHGVRVQDLGIAELHDCFTLAELLAYEAIGLAEPGRGCDVVRSGMTSLTGTLPVNTGGGLISFGHPVGATGIKQIMEVYRQMKGLCGDYQLSARPELGLTVNMGGDDKTVASMLLKNLA
mmetsp:Transcript_51090/g.115089  ORF Transcript_51090/g.115089 Transcript_51090/m.115089 type:complete len:427 (+) Transcript_51090:68-1348(+)